jgi:hypothetical protein
MCELGEEVGRKQTVGLEKTGGDLQEDRVCPDFTPRSRHRHERLAHRQAQQSLSNAVRQNAVFLLLPSHCHVLHSEEGEREREMKERERGGSTNTQTT